VTDGARCRPDDFPADLYHTHAWYNGRVNQTHHRGQVTTLLSQAGVDPGVTDLAIVLRDEAVAVETGDRMRHASIDAAARSTSFGAGAWIATAALVALACTGCAARYEPKPMPFKLPASMPNAQEVAGVQIAADAFADARKARRAFGFDARGAGLLPVQVVFDHRGGRALKINPAQSFLEDADGNLWPVLEENFAYERVTRFVETHEMFREGAYRGAVGAVAGAVVGAAVGVVTGDFGEAVGQGAAIGAGAGAVLGGAKGATVDAEDARYRIMDDFEAKSLENRSVHPGQLAYGFLFFPGEAPSARTLRLQLVEDDTGQLYTLTFPLA
jgi:hypothetical protein